MNDVIFMPQNGPQGLFMTEKLKLNYSNETTRVCHWN